MSKRGASNHVKSTGMYKILMGLHPLCHAAKYSCTKDNDEKCYIYDGMSPKMESRYACKIEENNLNVRMMV